MLQDETCAGAFLGKPLALNAFVVTDPAKVATSVDNTAPWSQEANALSEPAQLTFEEVACGTGNAARAGATFVIRDRNAGTHDVCDNVGHVGEMRTEYATHPSETHPDSLAQGFTPVTGEKYTVL
jgi:hypothetical protein